MTNLKKSTMAVMPRVVLVVLVALIAVATVAAGGRDDNYDEVLVDCLYQKSSAYIWCNFQFIEAGQYRPHAPIFVHWRTDVLERRHYRGNLEYHDGVEIGETDQAGSFWVRIPRDFLNADGHNQGAERYSVIFWWDWCFRWCPPVHRFEFRPADFEWYNNPDRFLTRWTFSR